MHPCFFQQGTSKSSAIAGHTCQFIPRQPELNLLLGDGILRGWKHLCCETRLANAGPPPLLIGLHGALAVIFRSTRWFFLCFWSSPWGWCWVPRAGCYTANLCIPNFALVTSWFSVYRTGKLAVEMSSQVNFAVAYCGCLVLFQVFVPLSVVQAPFPLRGEASTICLCNCTDVLFFLNMRTCA